MEQDFFTNVASEMIMEILSRMSVKDIMRCKCVCKSWRDLVSGREFGKLHLHHSRTTRSEVAFVAFHSFRGGDECEILEFNSSKHYKTTLRLPSSVIIHSSVDGLLFFCNRVSTSSHLLVVNPITRNHITVPAPPPCIYPVFGFGASENSGEYKLVRFSLTETKCDVITLGEASWRSISPPNRRDVLGGMLHGSALLNGKIHWLVYTAEYEDEQSSTSLAITLFDFGTEVFSSFSALSNRGVICHTIFALEGCVCLFGSVDEEENAMWMMKEYGNENSWTKVLSLKRNRNLLGGDVSVPLKVFRNGDMLVALENSDGLYRYSSKAKSLKFVKCCGYYVNLQSNIVLYTPSFAFLPMH